MLLWSTEVAFTCGREHGCPAFRNQDMVEEIHKPA